MSQLPIPMLMTGCKRIRNKSSYLGWNWTTHVTDVHAQEREGKKKEKGGNNYLGEIGTVRLVAFVSSF